VELSKTLGAIQSSLYSCNQGIHARPVSFSDDINQVFDGMLQIKDQLVVACQPLKRVGGN